MIDFGLKPALFALLTVIASAADYELKVGLQGCNNNPAD
jgi:hypothetical protein